MHFLALLKKELLRVIPLFFFFLFFFTLINEVEMFLFERAGIGPVHFFEIAIAAGLIAKIVLVVDQLPYITLFRKKPLAYVIVWKTFNYWLILFITRFLIRFLPYALQHGDHLAEDFRGFKAQFDWNLFISVQVFYLMFLFIYVTFAELALKIGTEKVKALFFGKK